ncbi:peptide deformylase [Truepera radiovictrix]|uniref:Peptide deformylase n=1 Tax=Truepera radiovictrix (strain DSM 17093 / CIP 108686 / LMG 22925 / RQ-24) TaxID=649638 RepID=D7CQ36_TRURR|nr:peptide deformylase [Truepera radiovictrix]ADI14820.1 peptide deformylase [Truepera radiovictrix DSM 17093]WMT56629.1 peptide deformylase [Truepera radiovictrix]
MKYHIRYFGDPVLRKVARPVTHFDGELETLAKDMIETMFEANGVGLAAPQIGLSKRLFVALELAPRAAEEAAGQEGEAEAEALSPDEKRERWGVVAEHVMVNPEIIARSGTQYGVDGCLSVPGLFIEKMKRDRTVRVRYQDLQGAWHEREAEGHFAHVIQHELDHLDGVLFFDRLPEAERRAFMEAHRRELAELQRQAKAYLKELREKGAPV